MRFQDKVVIVTGAGAGIGRETAAAFAAEGARVVVNSLSAKNTQATVDHIISLGGVAAGCAGDVSQEELAARLVQSALDRWGGVDILVNNAGTVHAGTVEQTTPAQWDRAMAVNVRSVFLLSRLAVAPMKRRGGGVIVNNASVVAVKGVPDRAAYSASKGAVAALSRAMAADYIGDGIRVNCVCPGTVHTPSLDRRIADAPDPEEAYTRFVRRQPLGRLGEAGEIAEAILFAAGNTFLTGATLIVDGGMHCAC